MTKEQIEGNKLIAEFCGWTIEPGMEDHEDPYYNQPQKDGYIPAMVLASNLRYHSSWDWLMPVVGKVESFGHSVSIFRGCCDIRFDGIKDGEEPDPIESGGGQPKIVSVFQSMVKFIQWYNAQKSNP